MNENEQPTYEQARDRLQNIVTQLERGGGNLQDQIALWQEGKQLGKICQDYLHDADAKIKAAVGGGSE